MWFKKSGFKFKIVLSLYFLLTVASILSCRSGSDQPPGDLIPKERMQEILWDMIRADIYVRDYILDSNKLDRNIRLYKEIFALHKTNREQFKESFAYYRAHPSEMKIILDSLEKRSKVQVPKPAEPKDTPRKLPVFKKRDTLRSQ